MGSKNSVRSKKDDKVEGSEIVGALIVVAGFGMAAIWGISKLFGSSGSNGKTMKAPGRDYRIFRDDFERDPADYFRNLRK